MMGMSDVEKVARALKVNPTTVRRGLEQGVFPFGAAIKCEKRYSYVFYLPKVKEFLGIELNDGKED